MEYSKDVITWDQKFMLFALIAAKKSRDPRTKVGAFIATSDNKPISSGYNGFPRGIDNNILPWKREGNWLDTKYPYICHAETNAIDNRGSNSLFNCIMYTTLFPCNECAKRIIQSGIKEVVYLSNKYKGTDSNIAATKLFDYANIKVRQLNVNKTVILELKND